MMRFRYLILFFILAFSASAQIRNTDTTVIEFKTQGKLPIANSLKVREQPTYLDTARMAPQMKYSIVSRPASPPVVLVPMKAATMEGEPLKKLYYGYVKAGMGTYTTPMVEVYLNQLRSKTASYGLHLKHISSSATMKDAGYAGYADQLVAGDMKYFMRKHTLSSHLGYGRHAFHYYGYDSSTDSITDHDYTKQIFHQLDLGVELKSHYSDSSRLNHKIRLDVIGQQDINQVRETNLLFRADMGKEYRGHYFGGDLVIDHLGDRQDFTDTVTNTLIKLEPFVQYLGKKFRARLGVSVVSSIADRNSIRIYPNMEVHYDVSDNIFVPYAGVGGGMQRKTFRGLATENPFLDPDQSFRLRNEDVRIEFYGGMRGALSRSVSYNIKASYKVIRDHAFFVTDTVVGVADLFELMENRFKLAYDTISHFTLGGELHFRKQEKLSLLVKGEYNMYDLNTERYAWHSPTVKLDAFFRYDLRDKIIVDLNMFYRSKQLAPVTKTQEADGVAEIKGYADVNLLLEYRYNKRLNFFLNTYNIGSVRYYRWMNYPHQRIQVMGGLSFSF